jgi:hypothetical protein
MNSKTWFITKAQIAAGDVEGAILAVDPEQIPDAEIFGLHGNVRLRIEGASGMADIIVNPQARKFFRALHQRWPWAGYFLRVNPLSPDSSMDQVVDLATFMALALCHLDQLSLAQTAYGSALRYDATQLAQHLAELQSRAAQLAEAVDLPPSFIHRRDVLISNAVTSFFQAGLALNSPPKKKRKSK